VLADWSTATDVALANLGALGFVSLSLAIERHGGARRSGALAKPPALSVSRVMRTAQSSSFDTGGMPTRLSSAG